MLDALAKMLGLSREHAEASMHSESAAKAALSRRDLFAAGAALAVGSAFSFAQPTKSWVQGWEKSTGAMATFRAFSIYFNGLKIGTAEPTWRVVDGPSGVKLAESAPVETEFTWEILE